MFFTDRSLPSDYSRVGIPLGSPVTSGGRVSSSQSTIRDRDSREEMERKFMAQQQMKVRNLSFLMENSLMGELTARFYP